MSDLPSQEMQELSRIDNSWRLDARGEGGDEARRHERRGHTGLLVALRPLLGVQELLLGLGGEGEGRVPP